MRQKQTNKRLECLIYTLLTFCDLPIIYDQKTKSKFTKHNEIQLKVDLSFSIIHKTSTGSGAFGGICNRKHPNLLEPQMSQKKKKIFKKNWSSQPYGWTVVTKITKIHNPHLKVFFWKMLVSRVIQLKLFTFDPSEPPELRDLTLYWECMKQKEEDQMGKAGEWDLALLSKSAVILDIS